MGVQGLWQLLQSTGRPVTLESLEGKVLSVDVSMWLHQTMKGMRDRHGNPLPNAHLLGLYHRICKLLYYRIKPVFVFDGGVPVLKRQTLAARKQRRDEAEEVSSKAGQKLLSNLLKHHALNTVLGTTPGSQEQLALSVGGGSKAKEPDIFELKPLPEPDRPYGSTSVDQESSEESVAAENEDVYIDYQNLEEVNTETAEFQNLPAEVRHDILLEIKDRKKRTHWAQIGTLPKQADDFSSFQVAKLMKQSKLSQKIENVRKELNSQGTGEMASGLLGETMSSHQVDARRMVSEDDVHFILIKGLSKNRHSPGRNTLEENTRVPVIVEDKIDVHDFWLEKRKAEKAARDAELWRDQILDDKKKDSNFTVTVSSDEDGSVESISSDDDKVQLVENKTKDVKFTHQNFSNCKVVDVNAITESYKRKISESESDKESETGNISSMVTHNNSESVEEKCHGKHSCQKYLKSTEEKIEDTSVVLSLDNKENKNVASTSEITLNKTADIKSVESRNENKQSGAVSEIMKKENSCDETSQMSDDEDSDDFIEVTFNPQNAKPDDELFPASIFNQIGANIEQEYKDIASEVKVTNDNKCEVKLVEYNDSKVGDVKDQASEIQVTELENTEKLEINSEDFNSDTADNENTSNVIILEDNEFDGMSKDELADLQQVLEEESKELQQEQGRQERAATSITDQMLTEAQELLRLFGLPYLVSPMEAEAQCAYLDSTKQTQGTITDDSDIWLFGGQNVYKNVFNQKKHVEWFCLTDIKSKLSLNRDQLINMALVCGSDYTTGIQGAGPVTAIEVMAEFKGEGLEPLHRFKVWWDTAQTQVKVKETKVKSKLRNLSLKEGFPNEAVVEAYLNPTVDDSEEAFTWGKPDLDLLRQYTSEKFGWSRSRTDETLLPVLKNLSATQTQRLLTSYFPTEMSEKRNVKSKRLKRALNIVRAPEVPSISGSSTSSAPVSKGKAGRGKKAKNSSQRPSNNNSGGFISRPVPPPKEVNLSESSSSSEQEFGDDDIDDDLLRNIDLETIQQQYTSKEIHPQNKMTNVERKRIPMALDLNKTKRKSKERLLSRPRDERCGNATTKKSRSRRGK